MLRQTYLTAYNPEGNQTHLLYLSNGRRSGSGGKGTSPRKQKPLRFHKERDWMVKAVEEHVLTLTQPLISWQLGRERVKGLKTIECDVPTNFKSKRADVNLIRPQEVGYTENEPKNLRKKTFTK